MLSWIMLVLFRHSHRFHFWPGLYPWCMIQWLYYFLPQKWDESLFVNLGFVAFEKVIYYLDKVSLTNIFMPCWCFSQWCSPTISKNSAVNLFIVGSFLPCCRFSFTWWSTRTSKYQYFSNWLNQVLWKIN